MILEEAHLSVVCVIPAFLAAPNRIARRRRDASVPRACFRKSRKKWRKSPECDGFRRNYSLFGALNSSIETD